MKMKKFLAALLTMSMVLSAVPMTAWAEDGGTGGEAGLPVVYQEDETETAPASTDEFKPEVTYVAQIGETPYETLEAAVKDAKSGETIKLLQEASGNGIVIDTKDKKSLVIDLGGYSYTVSGKLVGSSGTETNGFQLLKGGAVTFKNGTLKATNDAQILLQNYCDLTLENVTVDCSGTAKCAYAVSNNHGNITIKGNTNIYAKKGEQAFDLWYGMSKDYEEGVNVTVDTTGTIQGKIEYGASSKTSVTDWISKTKLEIKNGNFEGEFVASSSKISSIDDANIVITGGTFTKDPSAFVDPKSGKEVFFEGGKYVVQKLDEKTAVAKIGDNNYVSLEAAIEAVQAGQTILLNKKVTNDAALEIEKDFAFTLDLGGKTLAQRVNLRKGNLTVKNGTVKAGQALNVYGSANEADANYSVLTVAENVTLDADYCVCVFPKNNDVKLGYGIVVNMNSKDAKGILFVSGNLGNSQATAEAMSKSANAPVININSGAVIDGTTVEGQGVAINGYAKVIVADGAKISGTEAIGIKRGELVVNGGELRAYGEAPDSVTANNNGTEETGAAVSMTGTYNYAAPLKVTINGGKIVSKNGNALYVGHSVKDGNQIPFQEGFAVSVTGGSFSSGADKSVVFIADPISGDFDGYTQKVISGGYFTSDPAAYVVDGKVSLQSDKAGYAYMVGDRPVDEDNNPIVIEKPVTGATTGNVSEEVAAENKADAEAAAKSVTADEAIMEAAKTETLAEETKQAAVKEATEGKNAIAGATADNVTVYKQTYLDVEATNVETDKETGIPVITLEITPMMQVVASTATDAKDIKTEDGEGKNAVKIGEAKELTITTEVVITVDLPIAFKNANNEVFIKHKAKDGNTYFYTGKVVSESAKTVTVTFTSPHGFSPFTFSTKNEAVAEIKGIGYPTLQAAIDAAEDNATIKVVKPLNESIAARKTVTITVDSSVKAEDVVISPASRYRMTKDGDVYTFSKKPSSDPGSSSGGGGGSTSTKPVEKPEEKPADTEQTTTPVDPATIPVAEKIVLAMNNKVANVFGNTVVNDVAPIIRGERTMLPIRFVAEALGATVAWDGTQQKVTITKGEGVIDIYINSAVAFVNGNPVDLDSPAFIENSRTYLPLRFVAENLGADVYWNAETKEVTVVPNK